MTDQIEPIPRKKRVFRCHSHSFLDQSMRCELRKGHEGVHEHMVSPHGRRVDLVSIDMDDVRRTPRMVYRWDLGPKYWSWTELHGYMPQKARSREA